MGEEEGESYKSILACITPAVDAFDADVGSSGSISDGRNVDDGTSEISWKGGNWRREEYHREEGEE